MLSLSEQRKKQIQSNKKRKALLPEITRSEVNFLIFPFFALWDKDIHKRTKVEYKTVVKREGKKLEISWKVSANPEYGYPGPFDRKVHKAIEQLINQLKLPIQNPISLGSFYSLCKKLNIKKYGGREYKLIKKTLQRIIFTGVESRGTFYSKEEKKWIEDNFHLYERVIFKGKQLPNGGIADTNYLFLGSWYLNNINARYVKPIDWKYYKLLKTPIATRLYELLSVKFYGLNNKERFIRYRYSTLCSLLPITHQKYKSLAKQQLDSAHKKLKETEFLEKYLWRSIASTQSNQKEKDWYLLYYPGERAKKEMRKVKTEFFESQPIKEALPEPKKKPQSFSKTQINLVNQLVKLNISKITANDLVKYSNQQIIKKWIKAIYYTKAKDKAAYLVKAIKENWQAPEEYLKAEENERKRKEQEKIKLAKEKKEKEEQRKRQEEAKKLDKIYNSLNPLKQKEVKEETEKRLPFFIKNQLKKEKISKLTMATLENKKREIVKEWLSSGKIKKEGV